MCLQPNSKILVNVKSKQKKIPFKLAGYIRNLGGKIKLGDLILFSLITKDQILDMYPNKICCLSTKQQSWKIESGYSLQDKTRGGG